LRPSSVLKMEAQYMVALPRMLVPFAM
jgi:hypothetical protein